MRHASPSKQKSRLAIRNIEPREFAKLVCLLSSSCQQSLKSRFYTTLLLELAEMQYDEAPRTVLQPQASVVHVGGAARSVSEQRDRPRLKRLKARRLLRSFDCASIAQLRP